MKKNWIFIVIVLTIFSCEEKEIDLIQDEPKYFLSDIRPIFFENVNFESAQIKSEIPVFLNNFKMTYDQLERQYKTGLFTSKNDLENMRLASNYYSFYLSCLVQGCMDEDLKIKDIIGERKVGLYSKIPTSDPSFMDKEMNKMMEKAEEISFSAINLNGYNDRSQAFFIGVKQVQNRLNNKGKLVKYMNNPMTQDSAIKFLSTPLTNYSITRDWNILMSMVTFTNYKDSVNTFYNNSMNTLLSVANSRLSLGSQRTNRLPDILGPLYRFDLNLKKIDWLFDKKSALNKEELTDLLSYINTLETITNYIDTDRKKVLDTWRYKSTYDQRKEKVAEIKDYVKEINKGNINPKRPDFKVLLNSNEFKKAYTCYGCHQPTGL